mmetsp:Transcript_23516/g.45837  ORF Transcript_23516/g.45837 Transcript_23516/m.45837 type:complete len:285 (-) Transcript_23516:538-1392(-)
MARPQPPCGTLALFVLALPLRSREIIGGHKDWKFQYLPERLQLPPGTNAVNCHGLALDSDGRIYLTYQNDGRQDPNCLVRWAPDGTNGTTLEGGGTKLCAGTAHGLKIAREQDAGGESRMFLYHANNDQKLTKTHLNGSVVWQVNGTFAAGQDPAHYRPTWFGVPPDILGYDHLYLADGYGSSNVYVFTKSDGLFANLTFGGKGTAHGKFHTNHGITFDARTKNKIIVSDRENHRLEVFEIDPSTPSKFNYSSTILIPHIARPCNIRMYPALDGIAVVRPVATL